MGRLALAALLLALACAPKARVPPASAEAWSEADRSVMVRAEDLDQFLNTPLSDADTATWVKLRGADGSLRLATEYFSLRHGMGLTWTVTLHPDVAAAEREMRDAARAIDREDPGARTAIRRVDGFYEWGDESLFAVVEFTASGEPGGNFFAARSGATTVSLSLTGVYFFERTEFHRLVGPALANLLFYPPGARHE